MKNQKIHFIKVSHFGYYNQGDIYCSPYPHFEDYFSQFDCVLHSMDGFHFEEISQNDIVILGGGGILDFEVRFNEKIDALFEKCKNVILWGAGQNSFFDPMNGPHRLLPEIDFSRFTLSGIRDVGQNAAQYTPCPSSIMPQLKENTHIQPTEFIGTMFYNESALDALGGRYPNLSHYNSIEDVLTFIARFEVIITESYHCALWSTLSGRKVIMPAQSLENTKFNFMKYPPVFVDFADIIGGINPSDLPLKSFPNAYDESKADVLNFFAEVKKVIDSVIEQKGSPSRFAELHRLGELAQICDVLLMENEALKRTTSDLQAQLDRQIMQK